MSTIVSGIPILSQFKFHDKSFDRNNVEHQNRVPTKFIYNLVISSQNVVTEKKKSNHCLFLKFKLNRQQPFSRGLVHVINSLTRSIGQVFVSAQKLRLTCFDCRLIDLAIAPAKVKNAFDGNDIWLIMARIMEKPHI